MDKEFVAPNLHVTLVHFPLALLIIGTLIELFFFLWPRGGFRAAGRWMILLGALLSVPTLFSGIFAYYDVAKINNPNADAHWREMRAASPMSAEQWHFLWEHVWHEIVATTLALLAVLTWIASSDRFRRRLRLPLLVILILGNLFLVFGAYHAGETIYRHGTAVKIAKAPAPEIETKTDHVIPTTAPALLTTTSPATQSATMPTTKEFILPLATTTTAPAEAPRAAEIWEATATQMHVIFAGVTVAIALAALSLSIRAWTSVEMASGPEIVLETPAPSIKPGEPLPTADLLLPVLARPRVPSTRFWFLALLAAVITAILGDVLILMWSDKWSFKELLDQVRDSARASAHGILAVTIILLVLVLAIISRWAPRQKMLMTIFSALLMIAVGLQIWMGILLLYDSMVGPLMKFQ